MRRYIYETLHPDIYHGYNKKPPYFEGWYYKLISADAKSRYAIIPGIFRAKDATQDHAFIQVLDGMSGQATYHQFPINAFYAHEEIFDVRIGKNDFSKDSISLNIDDDLLKIKGKLHFTGGTGWPITLLSPGVMGWYAWLPFMETYHGVVSFDHRIDGALTVENQTINFDSGRGYIEKDWGQAFPSAYVWMQSNHFQTVGTSLSASIAMIPSVGRTFRGFLVGFYHQRRLYRMTTYTGATTERLEITDEHVRWTVRDRKYRLIMTAKRAESSLLHAPIRTEMHKRVDETMKASIHIRFAHLSGELIYEDVGHNAGLEVHGDLETLLNAR